MNQFIDVLLSFSGTLITVLIIILSLIVSKWIFKRIKQEKEKSTLTRQVIYVIIILFGALALTISLPIERTLKGQIIGLIGIVLSAAFAFSSTTLIGNALAGLMNANIKNFKLGDFIRIENNFGRVTKKGLFRTEIQTEDRNLTSLPNLYIANNPLKIIRESGTIISTTVSLGYDLNRSKIETSLLEAAKNAGLTEPFVFITNLGDFSVTYKINGMLTDITKYFTVTSNLNANVMDHLHKGGIEIVSPKFMNQRQVNDIQFIPEITKVSKPTPDEKLPEEIVFDKAIKADKIDDKIESLEKIDEEIKQLKSASKDAKDIALEYIEKLDLKGFENYYPNQLSGGMSQRVSIGRAFAIGPDILLMDEPFSALDLGLKDALLGIVQEMLAHHQSMTVLYVSHDPEEVSRLAKRFLLLIDGGVIQEFSPGPDRSFKRMLRKRFRNRNIEHRVTG